MLLYVMLLVALAGTAGSFAPGPHVQQALWSSETVARATPVDGFHREVLRAADSWLGVPYHYAGFGPGHCPSGEHACCVDCSGLVCLVYAAAGVQLPRTSAELAGVGVPVTREQAEPGDILVFRNDGKPDGAPNHSGLYVGNGLFLHASSRGVRLDELDGPYWGDPRRPRLRGIRRVTPNGDPQPSPSALPTPRLTRAR